MLELSTKNRYTGRNKIEWNISFTRKNQLDLLTVWPTNVFQLQGKKILIPVAQRLLHFESVNSVGNKGGQRCFRQL